MKARVLTLIVLLAMSAAALAQVQTYPWYSSFRNQSTSGLLEDDLDLMLGSYGFMDPARITLIDGRRLYTNLANIYTRNEEQFNPSDAGTYVVGGTSDIFGYGKLGLLFSKNTFKVRDSLSYVDVTLEEDADSIANPGWDFRGVEEYQEQYQETRDQSNYYLAWGKQVNDMKLGLAFKRYQSSYMEDYFSDLSYRYNNINTGSLLYTAAEKDTFSDGYNTSLNFIGLSVWKPLNEKMDASLRLAIGFGDSTNIDEYNYSWDESLPGGASYQYTEDGNNTIEYSGFAFSGGGAYVYKWNDKADIRFDLQYGHVSFKPKSGTSWEDNEHEQYLNPITYSEYWDYGYTETLEGEYTASDIDFRAVHKARLNRAEFAIGFGLSTGNFEDTKTFDRARTEVYRYNELNDPSLSASYVETTTWGEQWEEMRTGNYLYWTFPVCVEFDLTKKIVFRLGAQHQISNHNETRNEVLTGGDDMSTTTTVTGTGVTTITHSPNPLNMTTGYSETSNNRHSETDYIYGAGWNVTDNLKLDFMGFAQLNDLTNWKLSAVFKF